MSPVSSSFLMVPYRLPGPSARRPSVNSSTCCGDAEPVARAIDQREQDVQGDGRQRQRRACVISSVSGFDRSWCRPVRNIDY